MKTELYETRWVIPGSSDFSVLQVHVGISEIPHGVIVIERTEPLR